MAMQKREKPDERQLVSAAEIARITGMTEQWIRQLARNGIISAEKEKGVRGRLYDQMPTLQKLMVYYREKAEQNYDPVAEKMADEKLQLLRAKRELEEIKVRRVQGELHHTEDIKQIFGVLVNRLLAALEPYPQKVAQKLVGTSSIMEVAGILKKDLDKILYEVTNYDIDKLKTDIGADYIAQLEAEDKTAKRGEYETGRKNKRA